MKGHVGFWVATWIIVLLAVPFLFTTEQQTKRIHTEVATVTQAFGYEKTQEIVKMASSVYRAAFIDTHLLTEENNLYTKDRNNNAKELPGLSASKSFSTATNSYFKAFSVNVFGVMLRFGITCHWLLFIFPFLLAAFADGFVTRKIKLTSFGYISPMAYSFALHSIIFMMAIPMIYLIAPLPLTPYFMPMWALACAGPVIMLVSNTQRLFNA